MKDDAWQISPEQDAASLKSLSNENLLATVTWRENNMPNTAWLARAHAELKSRTWLRKGK